MLAHHSLAVYVLLSLCVSLSATPLPSPPFGVVGSGDISFDSTPAFPPTATPMQDEGVGGEEGVFASEAEPMYAESGVQLSSAVGVELPWESIQLPNVPNIVSQHEHTHTDTRSPARSRHQHFLSSHLSMFVASSFLFLPSFPPPLPFSLSARVHLQ